MAKQKLSITIDEEKVEKIDEMLKEGKFRNKSHVIEYSLDNLLNSELNIKESKKW